MISKRAAGILLPLFSLPSNEGRGCLDQNAFDFIDWLKDTHQSYWQLLPLGATFRYGNPYSAYSSFGGDPAFLSLEKLYQQGLLKEQPLSNSFSQLSLNELREEKLSFISKNLLESETHLKSFNNFLAQNHSWIYDFASFSLLSKKYGKQWNKWPKEYADYNKDRLKLLINTDPTSLPLIITQWLFSLQWNDLHVYAKQNGIELIGDIPIYVDHHSIDLWPSKELFKLDKIGEPLFVSGAPPDQFSKDGQVWNTPIFNWDAHKKENFTWWQKRIKHIFELFDIVRIDHFRGLQAYWEIPNASEPDAKKGAWVNAPGKELFTTLEKDNTYELVVEDLGDIDQDVRELRDHFNFPGMKILQFAFDTDSNNEYLPHNISNNSIVYTGTHDNDTIMGWMNNIKASPSILKNLEQIVDIKPNPNFNWDMINLAHQSMANTSIIPLADILAQDSTGRINIPGTVKGNWSWSFDWKQLTCEMSKKLKELTINSNRSHV